MYQINKVTGDIKQGKKLSEGYLEVDCETYEKFKKLEPQERLAIFSADDGDFDNCRAKKLIVTAGNNSFESDGNENKTNGGYIGRNPLTATETFRLNALTGDANFAGNVTTKDFDASGTATARSQKGNKSKLATIEDLSSATVSIISPKNTLSVGASGNSITLDANIATSVKAGLALFPLGGGLTIDAAGNVRIDGAIAPFKYIDIWDASTNTPKLSDATGKPETFYITHVRGTQNLGSGAITFEIGDWVLCQEDIGGSPRYAKVPMSEVLGNITATMIKAGTLGHGIIIDSDQPIKTSASVQASSMTAQTITVTNIVVTGSIVGQV